MKTPAAFSLALVLLFAAPALAAAEKVVLVAPQHQSVLVIRHGWKQAVWSDWGGHGILKAWVREATGVDLPVVQESELATQEARAKYGTRIWIGRTGETNRVIGAELDQLDDDGFILRAAGNDVYVAGKKWWGDNWAAHDLLKRFAGCRWYGPEKTFWTPEKGIVGLFDIIPKQERIEVPADLNVVEQPGYKMRWFRFMPMHSFRLRYRDDFHHAMVGIIDPRKYGESHPEWFPLIDGQRRVPPPGHEFHFQPCASNEEVTEHVANAAITHFKEKPDSSSYSVGMNDTDKFCECDKCLAIAPASITDKQQRLAYAFFDFYNRIAAKVEAAGFGDKRLGCLGYAGLSVLPKGSIRMHRMLVPYLTRDSAQLFDPSQEAEFKDIVATWNGLAERMGIYEYIYGGGFVVPRIYNRYLIKNVQEQYGVGVDGFYAESYPNFGLDGPKYWLLARMLWDPKQDPEALLDEWHTNLFGPASGTMRDYFDFLEETWCTQSLKSDRSNYRWFLDAKQLEIFPPETCEKAWAMLLDAENQAHDPLILKRIAYFKDTFAVTRALSARYAAAGAVEHAVEQTKEADLADAMPSRLAALQGWLDAPDPAPVLERALAMEHALDPNVIPNNGGYARFDRQPIDAVAATVSQILARAIDGQADLSAAAVRERLRSLVPDVPGAAGASELLRTVTADSGVLAIGVASAAPSVDGTIKPEEWPEPAFAGRFFALHQLARQPEQTTVYAARQGRQLFLAFDLEQDPATVGGDATGPDTGGWDKAAMVNDDCVSITFHSPGVGFRSIRINVNSSVGFDRPTWEGVVTAAAARKTEKGWQAEMAIDLDVLAISTSEGGKSTFAIARYTRRPLPQADANAPVRYTAHVSTMLPAPPGEGIIGRGNHPGLMTFVTGPRALFQKD